MKWIVTLPDGKKVEETGGAPADAARNAADMFFGDPLKYVGQTFKFHVERKNKTEYDKPADIILGARAYWGEFYG